jgi:hypothetical protein
MQYTNEIFSHTLVAVSDFFGVTLIDVPEEGPHTVLPSDPGPPAKSSNSMSLTVIFVCAEYLILVPHTPQKRVGAGGFAVTGGEVSLSTLVRPSPI